ncbi:MAG TPA: ABC transporter ATP-binding protein [Dongiaceae bacterium]|nr:ABC transporter ATP-binding protein [Dongiaceae bacterium]
MLSVEDLGVSYGGIRAVKGISLSLDKGSIVALIGANGAGKSTTLRAVSGLTEASGRVTFDGEDITDLPPHDRVSRGISQVPEGRRIFGRLSVRENIEVGALHRRDRAKIAADFEHVLKLFPRLKERLRQVAGTLSGGEQQMLAMARSLMSAPRVLLLDEPSMGLAPQMVAQVFSVIEDLKGEGLAILLVEQNAIAALEISSRGYVLESGEITLSDSGRALIDHPGVRKAYLG